MARAKQSRQIHQMTVAQFEEAFPDEHHCDAYLVAHRWPQGVRCPRCDSDRVYELKTRPWHWECPDCRHGGAYRFSDIAGTVFENTKIDLRQWFRVIHLMLTSKKGISARQIHRYMGFGSYSTAWYVCHRVRAALIDPEFRKLIGYVEVDETFIGGKRSNKHKRDRRPHVGKGNGPVADKFIVAGAVERKGRIVARVVENAKASTLTEFIREAVSDKVSLISTDEWSGYRSLGKEFPHKTVDHSKDQYVVGAVHTQTIEGFWSLLKRGIVGTYQNCYEGGINIHRTPDGGIIIQ
jgi:transposase-like protein/IS1 family transposase